VSAGKFTPELTCPVPGQSLHAVTARIEAHRSLDGTLAAAGFVTQQPSTTPTKERDMDGYVQASQRADVENDLSFADPFETVSADQLAIACGGFDCTKVSTSQYRKTLKGLGVDLTGLDVDHVVPKSLGGADHPGNYILTSSHLNRSQGNDFGPEKCERVGMGVCKLAVEVSRECGTYDGWGP
jgi:hypothetical protein